MNNKIYENEDFIQKMEEELGYRPYPEQISAALYAIYLDHENDFEQYINSKILIDGLPYRTRLHGDAISIAKRYLKNSSAFQFDESFVTILCKGE